MKIGEKTVTVGEFEERLPEAVRELPEDRRGASLRDALDRMVHFELLAVEAGKRGLSAGPAADRAADVAMVEEMMRDLFERDGPKLGDIGEPDMLRHYDEHRADFAGRAYEDVKPLIRNRLWRAKHADAIDGFVASLRDRAHVHEEPALLDGARIDAAPLARRP